MWFINLLTGGLAQKVLDFASGIFSKWSDNKLATYTVGVNADAQVIAKQLDAQIELNKLSASLAIADKGWWVTAWMKPALFYTFLPHVAAYVFDQMPMLGHTPRSWGIGPLPDPNMASLETYTMLAVIGIVGIKGVARIFTK